jgi:hypothetical protein
MCPESAQHPVWTVSRNGDRLHGHAPFTAPRSERAEAMSEALSHRATPRALAGPDDSPAADASATSRRHERFLTHVRHEHPVGAVRGRRPAASCPRHVARGRRAGGERLLEGNRRQHADHPSRRDSSEQDSTWRNCADSRHQVEAARGRRSERVGLEADVRLRGATSMRVHSAPLPWQRR